MTITAEYAHSILKYNTETGVFTWCWRNDRFSNKEAGTVRRDGYVIITVNYKRYLAHRLAWLWTFGVWPRAFVDHVNGLPSDNRIANLRLCTQAENLHNSRIKKTSTSGLKGAMRNGNGWMAQIRHDGVRTYLGWFSTPEAAAAAYQDAAIKYHGSFARTK
jgi:hypothetical protein